MSKTSGQAAFMVALVAIVVLLAIGSMLLPTDSSGPAPLRTSQAGKDTPQVVIEEEQPDEPVEAASSSKRPRASREAGGRPFQMTAPPGAIPPSTRPFESPEAAAAFVEDRVLDLFAAVSPELDPKTIHKSCKPDGRTCTFEGPWPGDDFLREWLRAISDGRTGLDQMQGVRFSEFKPVDEGDERRFHLVAHAP